MKETCREAVYDAIGADACGNMSIGSFEKLLDAAEVIDLACFKFSRYESDRVKAAFEMLLYLLDTGYILTAHPMEKEQ